MHRSGLKQSRDALVLGLVLGVIFGTWNVLGAYLAPLADDTISAVAAFYGPMFAAWGIAGFVVSRRTGRRGDGARAGALTACATFAVLTIIVIARVNLTLDVMRQRPDWQNLIARFAASGFESLRAYVNYEYLKGAPFKIFVATSIGAVFGFAGGCVSLGVRRRMPAAR